jgi:hypothetical protein
VLQASEGLGSSEEQEVLTMCYEYWHSQKMLSEEDKAKKRAQELIDKARSAKPAPKANEPVPSEKDNETVPA